MFCAILMVVLMCANKILLYLDFIFIIFYIITDNFRILQYENLMFLVKIILTCHVTNIKYNII